MFSSFIANPWKQPYSTINLDTSDILITSKHTSSVVRQNHGEQDEDFETVTREKKNNESKPPPKKPNDHTQPRIRQGPMTEEAAERIELSAKKFESGKRFDAKDMLGFVERSRAALDKKEKVVASKGDETKDAESSLAAENSISNQSDVPSDIADGRGNSRGNSGRGRGGGRGGQGKGGRGGITRGGSRSRSRGSARRNASGGRGGSSERGSHGD
ncbi:hypothetical protein Landi51_05412 [Colletotrichum acutatum]